LSKKKITHNDRYQDFMLPQCIIDEFARFLVPEIQKYYESEQGQREFAQWKAEKERNQDNPVL